MKLLAVIFLFGHFASSEGMNPVWSIIPGKLKQVDLSPADNVWGVNSGDYIYIFVHSRKTWQNVGGRLKHVSVGDSGVWGANSADNIYYRRGVSSSNLAGASWVQIGGKLKQIDSGPKGIVYGVNSGDRIYCRTGITDAKLDGTGWREVGGRLKYVSCGLYGCWGVNSADNIYFRTGVTPSTPQGVTWVNIPGKLKQIEVNGAGEVFGVNSGNNVYIREGITQAEPTGTHWKFIRGGFKHISAGINTVFALDPSDSIFFYNELSPLWSLYPGKLTQLDISPFDNIWGVNSADDGWYRDGNIWRRAGYGLKHVTTGGSGVWGINELQQIFYRKGVTSNSVGGTHWSRVTGPIDRLKQIDSGPAGIVYGVDEKDDIFCRLGITSDNRSGKSWKQVGGKLKYVSCGSYGCWGTNSADNIYFRNGITLDKPEGTNWIHIPGKLKQIEVSSDGKVYGVNSGKEAWLRVGITPNKPTGTVWRRIFSPGLTHISAGASLILGIDHTDSIYQFTGLEFPEERHAILLTDKFPQGGIGKIRVRHPVPGIVYSLTAQSNIVQIDSASGQLTLLVDVSDQNVAQVNNSQFIVKAKLGIEETIVSVIIYVLPLFYGDPLALPAMTAVKKGLESSQTINLNYGPAAEISPEILSRILKQVSRTDPVFAMSEAETRVERAIDLVESTIIHAFEREYGRGAVLAFLHIRQLFSTAIVTKLDRESSCTEVASVVECPADAIYRRSDGKCSNLKFPTGGATGIPYERLIPAKYFDVDGLNDPIDFPDSPNAPDVPTPNEVARDFIKDEVASSAAPDLTHAVMQFGQFLDHDLDLSAGGEGSTACSGISCTGVPEDFVPPCYPILELGSTPCVRFVRSAAMCQTEGYPMAREQINDVTGVIDGNNIYGSSEETTLSLRDRANDVGLMRVSDKDGLELLPEDVGSTACIQGCFKAGDIRANEQQGLTSFHTLFLREHNRIARRLKTLNNNWDGETVFQETRKIVGAVLQKIVYRDYLPIILGPNALPPYQGHDENVNPSILNGFAAAAYRFGHSTIRSKFDLLGPNFDPVAPAMLLRHMFFNNTPVNTYGIEPVLFGLVGNISERVDTRLSPEITEHLFERGNIHGENLAALNLQRSRDHGLPGYNHYRQLCGLTNAITFEDTQDEIQDPDNRAILHDLYGDPNLVELWMAGLAEVPVPGGTVGRTLNCILTKQFLLLRDGDRFYYANEGVFTPRQRQEINKASLSRIYCDNLDGIVSIQKNAFKSAGDNAVRPSCTGTEIPRMSLCQWKVCPTGQTPQANPQNNECSCQ